MAASVHVMFSGNNKYIINVTGVYSVADETDTVIVDRSALIGPDQVNVPTYIVVERITYDVQGFTSVLLEWDDATDEVIEYLGGAGYFDYKPVGGKKMAGVPNAAGDGDILLTTAGGSAGDTYSLMLECRLKA